MRSTAASRRGTGPDSSTTSPPPASDAAGASRPVPDAAASVGGDAPAPAVSVGAVAQAALTNNIADADAPGVDVLDLASGAALARLELDGPARLSATDGGRYVMAGQADHDTVAIIDGGSWSEPHGDHRHHYTAAPAVATSVDGTRPAHLVSHDDTALVFFDGDGAAEIIDLAALADGDTATVGSVDTGTPHHGVAVIFADHILSTIPSEDAEEGPIGVAVRHGDEIEAEFPECPGLHGELVTDAVAAFACDDGVLAITADGQWRSAKIAYPDDAGRLWTLAGAAELDWAAGAASQSGPRYGALPSVVIVDLAGGDARAVETPAPVFAVGVEPGTRTVVALHTDGTLSHVDPVAGEVVATTGEVVEPFEVDYEQTLPALVLAGGHAYVSDPAAATVTELHVADGLEVEETIELPVTPGSIAVVGAE